MTTYKRVDGDYVIKTLGATDIVNIESTTTVISGDLSVSGNATLLGNISGDKLFNGTSNVEISSAGGNVTIGVGGTSVATYATTGHYINGLESVTGNIIGGNINTAGLVTAVGNIIGGNITTLGNVTISRDASAGQPTIRFNDTDSTIDIGTVIGAVEWYTNDSSFPFRVTTAVRSIATSTTGNARYEILTSSGGTGATAKFVIDDVGNVGIANTAPLHTLVVSGTIYGSSTLTAIGNVNGGNLITGGLVTATGNVTGGNINSAGLASITGNITGGNIISLGAISAGAGGVSATGNITGGNVNSTGIASITGNIIGGNVITGTTLSASGNIIGGNVVVAGSNVTGTSFGTGIGVENIVWQPTTVAFDSAVMANVGSLGFFVSGGYSYKFEAYMPIIPDGSATTAFSTYFDAGTCYYTLETQATQTSAWAVVSSNSSATTGTTQNMTGTTPRTVRISGTIYSAGNANVSIQASTTANLNIQSGSFLTYTRLS